MFEDRAHSTNPWNRTALAHIIREQAQVYLRSLVLLGYTFDGVTPIYIYDDDLAANFLPQLNPEKMLRPYSLTGPIKQEEIYPRIYEMTSLEVEKLERDRERDSRWVNV